MARLFISRLAPARQTKREKEPHFAAPLSVGAKQLFGLLEFQSTLLVATVLLGLALLAGAVVLGIAGLRFAVALLILLLLVGVAPLLLVAALIVLALLLISLGLSALLTGVPVLVCHWVVSCRFWG